MANTEQDPRINKEVFFEAGNGDKVYGTLERLEFDSAIIVQKTQSGQVKRLVVPLHWIKESA